MQPSAGRLLVATPDLADPNFARTVVLLLDVGSEGALGVVLNRPMDLAVGAVLQPWADAVNGPDVLFSGGPVETGSALALAVAEVADAEEPLGWRRLFGSVGLVDLDGPPELLDGVLAGLRIFAGYAGWSASQLATEIDEGSWYVLPAVQGDLFVSSPADLWGQVLRRQGGWLAMLATLPEDPGMN